MADISQGMFGQDPALLQQAILQQEQEGYAKAGQGSFSDVLGGVAAAGGGMLGKGIGSMMGYQDPRLQDAQMMQQMQMKTLEDAKAAGIDPSNPMEYGKLLANNLMAIGKPKQAYDVIQQMQGMGKTMSETAKNNAEATAKLREKQYTVVGKNAIENSTGEWKTPPGGMGVDINNQYDAVDFLTQVKTAQENNQEVPQPVLNKAKAIYAMANKPQIGFDGRIIEPANISHLDPSSATSNAQMTDRQLADFANMLIAKGVPPDNVEQVLRKIKAGGQPIPDTQQAVDGSYKVGGRIVYTDPNVLKREQFKQAVEVEQRFKDDYVKAIENPKLVLEASQQVQALTKDRGNPSALNAAATIGQHLIEPKNQALVGEINRLMGGGDILTQVGGLVSKVVDGTASKAQVDWFVKYAEEMRNTALSSYKATLNEQYNNLSKYSEGNKEIKPSRVVTSEQLARYEGVPYITSPEQEAKLPPGARYYSSQDVKMRVTPAKR